MAFDAKSFITQARAKGVPDQETYKYLQTKGIIDQSGKVVSQQTQTTGGPTPKSQSIWQKAGKVAKGIGSFTSNAVQSIFPGGQLGKAIGTSIYGLGRLAKGDVEGAMQAGQENTGMIKPIAGDILKAGAMVGGLVAAPATLAGSAATFGAIGAATSAGQAMTENANLQTIAAKAFQGGLTGSVFGAAGYGVQKALQNAPESIMNNILKISSKIKNADKSPSEFLVNEGVWGSLGSMSKQVQTGMTKESGAIANAVAELDQAGDVATPIYQQIKDDAIAFLSGGKLGDLYNEKELSALVDKVPLAKVRDATNLSWTDLDSVRSSLGNFLGDSKWLAQTPTESTQATKAVYGAIADAIKGATGTDEAFARYAQWIEANKAIGKVLLNSDKKWGLSLYDTFAGAIGSAVGSVFGQPILGAAAGAGAERLARSPAVLSGTAQLVSGATNAAGSPIRAGLTTAAGNLIGSPK